MKKEVRETYRHLLWLSGHYETAEKLEPRNWRDYIMHARKFERDHNDDDAAFQWSEALDKAKELGDSYTQAATLSYIL